MKRLILISFMIILFAASFSFAQTNVPPGNGTLQEAIKVASAGDVLQLVGGAEYTDDSTSIALLDKAITIQVESGATQKAIVRLGESVPSGSYYFFMIMNSASLTLKGIEFSGLVGDVKRQKRKPVKEILADSNDVVIAKVDRDGSIRETFKLESKKTKKVDVAKISEALRFSKESSKIVNKPVVPDEKQENSSIDQMEIFMFFNTTCHSIKFLI